LIFIPITRLYRRQSGDEAAERHHIVHSCQV